MQNLTDFQTEQALLGALISDNDQMLNVTPKLKSEHFSTKRHQDLYHVLGVLFESDTPADFITISDWFEDNIAPYVFELIDVSPTGMHANYYADIVYKHGVKRGLIAQAQEMVKAVNEGDVEPDEIIADTIGKLMGIEGLAEKEVEQMPDGVDRFLADLEYKMSNKDSITGIKTGLYDLDKLIQGLEKKLLYVVAGRPGMGKSTLMMQWGKAAAKAGKRVMVFSYEMPFEQVIRRWVASELNISLSDMKKGKISQAQYQQIKESEAFFRSLPISFDTTANSPKELRAKVLKEKSRRGVDLVIVDYLQLMSDPRFKTGQNRNLEVAEISKMFKSLAMDLNCPVVVGSQLSRNVESRGNKQPMLSDLRDSGAIEQDADLVIFCYRDEYYNPDTPRPHMLDLIVSKHRDGETGIIETFFTKNFNRIDSTERERLDW